MELNQGDQFEVREENGKIILVPLAIYPEHVIKNLKAQVKESKESIKNGESPVFNSIDSLFEELDKWCRIKLLTRKPSKNTTRSKLKRILNSL